MGAKGLGSSEGSAAGDVDFATQFVRIESDDEAAAIVAKQSATKATRGIVHGTGRY